MPVRIYGRVATTFDDLRYLSCKGVVCIVSFLIQYDCSHNTLTALITPKLSKPSKLHGTVNVSMSHPEGFFYLSSCNTNHVKEVLTHGYHKFALPLVSFGLRRTVVVLPMLIIGWEGN